MISTQTHTKRFAVAAFAVLYACMVIGISNSKTSAWMDKFADRQSSGPSASIDKSKPFVPHLKRPRILQSHFVVETPQIVAGTLLVVDRHLDTTPDFQPYGHSPLRIPSRAPPSLI